MSGTFNDRNALWRLQEAATSFAADNPHSNNLANALSGVAFNTGANNLHPADRRGLSYIISTLQNSVPGMGTPVADFVAMNRALISGALPVTITGADGSSTVSNSYGTGNVSVAAAASIMRTFEDSMRTAAGTVDIGRTRGVSHNLRTNLLTHLVQQRGIQENDFRSFNLSEDRTADALSRKISLMSNKYDVEESSLKDLKKVRDAMRYLENNSNLRKSITGKEITEFDDVELSNALAGKFDDATIRQTLSQVRGNNKVFQAQTKQLNRELKEAYDAVADNVKELSHLFGTESLEELKNYAKGTGISNFLDKTKAHEVRAQMRDIAVTAAITGRSAQEVAVERVNIAAGMSAMYGGRAPSSGLIDVVQNAGIAASRAKESGVFTREASQAAATRSIANMQNLYGDAIVATGIFKEQEKIGGVTQEQRDEYNRLYAEMQNAKTPDDRRRAAVRLGAWARRNWGNTAMDSAEMRAKMLATYSEDFQDMHVESLISGNMETHARNIAKENGLTDAEMEKFKSVGTDIVKMFGNDEFAREKFLKAINDGQLDSAKNMLMQGGMDSAKASALISDVRSFGQGRLSSMLNPMLDASAWVQQIQGTHLSGARKTKFLTELLNKKEIGYKDNASAIESFMAGMLEEGGFTQQGILDASIANAMLKSNGDADAVKANLAALGLDAMHIGTVDAESGKFIVSDPEQRKLLMSKLGIESEEEFNKLLSDPERYVKRLESAGFMISSTKDGKQLIAASREAVDEKTKAMTAAVDNDDVRALQAVLKDGAGEVMVREGTDGSYSAKVHISGLTDASKEGVSATEAINLMAKSNKYLPKLMQMADSGSATASKAVHELLKRSANTSLDSDALGALKKDEEITANEYMAAAEADYGTRVDALLQKDFSLQKQMLIEAGMAQVDADGNLRLTQDIKGLNLTANSIIEEDTIESRINQSGGAARRKHMEAVMETTRAIRGDSNTEAPNKNQMSLAVDYLRQINDKLPIRS